MYTQISFLIAILSHFILVKSQFNEIDLQCIDCICKATGKCQYPLGCSNVGSGYYCGPLQISWNYWSDGGRLGDVGNKHDFEDCLTTKSCAEQTVRNYMKKYGQDCDGDGLITCTDFAILHKTGYRQCSRQSIEDTKYWREFTATKCYQQPGSLIREQPINRNNNQPHIVRSVFTSSSSSSSVRNVRRTISNDPNPVNHLNGRLNERSGDLRELNRNTFKELDSIPNHFENLHKNFPTAFDNFDTLSNGENNFNVGTNLNLPNRNHRELNIETSISRVARPHRQAVRTVVDRNNDLINFRKPLNSIRSNDQLNLRRINLPESSMRVISVGREQPNSLFTTPFLSPTKPEDSKLSNATVTIDGKCLDCICYGSTKCNLNMKCSGNFCGSFLISYAYWKEGGQLLNNYVNCANDFNCAKQTVANYMARHNRDCDLNQELTCVDFAIIHQSGGYECEKNSKQIQKSHYYKNFEKCYFNDEFHVFTNDDESVTGYSIITKPVNPPANTNKPPSNRSPVNQPRNIIPPEINLTNDWRPIEPFGRNVERVNENRETFNNNNNNSPSIQPSNNVRPLPSPVRPPVQPVPVNIGRPNSPPFNNLRPPNNQPPTNNRPIIVSNNAPDWIETSNESLANENNDNETPINENLNRNQPLSRSTRRPVRPPPRPFESNEEDVNEQPHIEPSNENNSNSYSSINNSNAFETSEVVPIENNNRRTSPRASSLTSNVIPVSPNSPAIKPINSTNNLLISQSCFDCICEATTLKPNCNERQNCFVNNFGEFVCGPYQLNRFFWVDSGKTNDNGEADAFEQCASNRECSQRTITAYMQRHSADCNEDEQIDCIDFAAMVRVGKKACTLQNLIDSTYWSKFQQCYGFGDD